MDGTDFRILARLFVHPLDGPEAVGRAVGLTRNAVARRLRLLQASPLALGFFALPHHSLFGRASTVHLYAVRGEPPAGDGLLALDDVIGYDVNHDGLCAVTTWHRPGAAAAHLDDALGGPAVARFTDATPGPAAPHLTGLEWKVAGALLAEPRASAAALARATGLAARTCARARDRLVAGRAVRVGLSLREDLAGYPLYRVYVQGRPDQAKALAILGPDAVVSDEVDEGRVWFARAPTTGGLMVAVERLRALPGVSDVKLILSRDNGVAVERLARWCREAAAAGRAGAAGAPERGGRRAADGVRGKRGKKGARRGRSGPAGRSRA